MSEEDYGWSPPSHPGIVCCSTSGECCGSKTPTPGSVEALDRGCLCPVVDNAHGEGAHGQNNLFIYTAGCPLHDTKDDPERDH